jgi:hypothetical protein
MVLLSAIFYGLFKHPAGLMLSCLNAAGAFNRRLIISSTLKLWQAVSNFCSRLCVSGQVR